MIHLNTPFFPTERIFCFYIMKYIYVLIFCFDTPSTFLLLFVIHSLKLNVPVRFDLLRIKECAQHLNQSSHIEGITGYANEAL